MPDLLTPEDFTPALARMGTRYVAILIDYAVYFGFYWVMFLNFGNTYLTDDGTTHYEVTATPALICFAFWFFIPILEGLRGQSIGKMICKIQVVRMNYEKASVGQCIARHLFDIIDFLPLLGIVGLLVARNNHHNQRVGDVVAKTIVIQK